MAPQDSNCPVSLFIVLVRWALLDKCFHCHFAVSDYFAWTHLCQSKPPYCRHILSYERPLNPPGKSAETVLTVSRQRREIESVCSLGMEWAKHGSRMTGSVPVSYYRYVCVCVCVCVIERGGCWGGREERKDSDFLLCQSLTTIK